MSKRVPPPPPGVRKGPPPPNRNIIKPSEQIKPELIQTLEKPQILINTTIQQQSQTNLHPITKQQSKQSKQKVLTPSAVLKNKPPIQNKRATHNIPNIPQKTKTVLTSTIQKHYIPEEIKSEQPKVIKPNPQPKQISQSFILQKEDSRKDNQMNSIKSKLDEVLNARSLLLENSQSVSQQQQQELENNNILVDELRQQQPNLDSNSDKFEELRQQQSNESSIKQIKQDLQPSEVIIEKTLQSEKYQVIKQDYEIIEPIINSQYQQQHEKINILNNIPPPPIYLMAENKQIKKQHIPTVAIQKQIIKEKSSIQSESIRTIIFKLQQKQRKMNVNLIETSQNFLQKQQEYLNKIDQLKRELAQKQQMLARLKSN